MIGWGAAATRDGLLRTVRRAARVHHGMGLLRKKREALVAELFRAARPAVDARSAIDARNRAAYEALLPALARLGADGAEAAGWPTRELSVDVRAASVWGVPIAEITARAPVPRDLEARGLTAAGVGADALDAARGFEELVETLLDAAPREALLRNLGEAVARTSRQVNVLERRLAPALERTVAVMRQTLDEREREERVRLGILVRGAGS
ncbi:MAG TPA: V-type ATP synthase subunit D [Gemmatimonadales bacterium]|nr:V-type ATP synthase subunit D [Gemmatimonadales bacterium]